MHIRPVLSTTLALLLLSGVAATAVERPGAEGLTFPKIGLSKLFGAKEKEPLVQMAQTGDPRVTALEEQIRSLAGTVEELNFQILQMQEQIRKMQEDNEFRFQELEKKTDAGVSGQDAVAEKAPAEATGQAKAAEVSEPAPSVEEIIVEEGDPSASTAYRSSGNNFRNDHL